MTFFPNFFSLDASRSTFTHYCLLAPFLPYTFSVKIMNLKSIRLKLRGLAVPLHLEFENS